MKKKAPRALLLREEESTGCRGEEQERLPREREEPVSSRPEPAARGLVLEWAPALVQRPVWLRASARVWAPV